MSDPARQKQDAEKASDILTTQLTTSIKFDEIDRLCSNGISNITAIAQKLLPPKNSINNANFILERFIKMAEPRLAATQLPTSHPGLTEELKPE